MAGSFVPTSSVSVVLASVFALLVAGSANAATTAVSLTEAAAQGGAFSFLVTAADIPTLGEWAVISLLVLMAAYAVWRLRKNPAMARGALSVLVLISSSVLVAGVAGSALSVAGHDPATMLSATVNHARTVTARLEPEAGKTVTGTYDPITKTCACDQDHYGLSCAGNQ
jgi:hypothetical protein